MNAPQKVGILGGGQLARMLALAAHPMGLIPYVLSEKADDPAAQVTSFWQQGSPHQAEDLRRFLKEVDVVTFESEFIDAQMLAKVATENNKPVFPSPEVMGSIQDRLSQKNLLKKYKLPTAEFLSVDNYSEAEEALARFPGGFVLKQRRNGYDGYGTFVVKNQKVLPTLQSTISDSPFGFIAEEFVPFDREVAVICARTLSGQIEFMPFVESRQKDSRCFWVKGPLKETAAMKEMKTHLKRLLAKTNYVGVLGVEFFETKKKLVINELAPRVHNTGHYSQDALVESQFHWHLKCLLGQKLRPAKNIGTAKGFAMVNLLGKPSDNFSWPLPAEGAIHWYGKKESKPGRKMGHINSVGENPEKALTQALNINKACKI